MPDYFNDDYNEESESGIPDEAPEGAMADNQPASQVALLPIDFFGGKDLQPGATCDIRIEKVLSDQVQVSYVGHEEGGEDMMA